MPMLNNNRFVITGVSAERSIAHGIACVAHAEGAELILTYNNARFECRVRALAEELNAKVIRLDASDDASVAACAESVKAVWPDGMDGFVHSIAWAPREAIQGSFLEGISRDGFLAAMSISVYSFAALAKAFLPQMEGRRASMLTVSYLGAEKVLPNYNTMGVAKAALESMTRYMAADLGPRGMRVNALSCGPVRTLAASGIKDFSRMLAASETLSPMRENITTTDAGNAAAFLLSDLARMTTGQTVYVDGGFEILAPGAL